MASDHIASLHRLCQRAHEFMELIRGSAEEARLTLETLRLEARAAVGAHFPSAVRVTAESLIESRCELLASEIDRAVALKTSRLEAELVAADAAMERTQAAEMIPAHGDEPVEIPVIRLFRVLPDAAADGPVIATICAPRGINARDIFASRVASVVAPHPRTRLLSLSLSESYECRAPGEVSAAMSYSVGRLCASVTLKIPGSIAIHPETFFEFDEAAGSIALVADLNQGIMLTRVADAPGSVFVNAVSLDGLEIVDAKGRAATLRILEMPPEDVDEDPAIQFPLEIAVRLPTQLPSHF